MNSDKVIVFGHSHLGALVSAYEQATARSDLGYELITYQFLRGDRPHIVNTDGRGWHYHDEIERDLIRLIESSRPAAVAIMLQGEQAAMFGLTAPVKPYDFFFPGEIGHDPDPGSDIVPFDLILKVHIGGYKLIADFMDLMKGRLPSLAFALCPPPPNGDNQHILNTEIQFGNLSRHIEKFGLPSPTWRYRIWKVNTMALRTIYGARDIAFIDPPCGSYDKSGCMRPEFRADVFHANAKYGQLLLNQIDRILRDGACPPESQKP